MPLTDTAIRNAKPLDKPYKLSDAQGLYLLIKPNGSKLWHLKYRFGGKEKKLAFSAYPTVTLANARKLREEARSVLNAGDEPGVKKQQAKKSGNTFEEVARKWLAGNIRWTEIDLDGAMWTIPAQREPIPGVRYSEHGAKMKTPHLVLLSKQAMTVLKQLKLLSGNGELLFPGDHDPRKPMSENTINKALRVMGYTTRKWISVATASARWPVVR